MSDYGKTTEYVGQEHGNNADVDAVVDDMSNERKQQWHQQPLPTPPPPHPASRAPNSIFLLSKDPNMDQAMPWWQSLASGLACCVSYPQTPASWFVQLENNSPQQQGYSSKGSS